MERRDTSSLIAVCEGFQVPLVQAEPPPQKCFVITLVTIGLKQAELTLMDGTEVIIHFKAGKETSTVKRPLVSLDITVQTLGKACRLAAGLPPRTPPDVTVRITWQGKVLPQFQPLRTLLPPDLVEYMHEVRGGTLPRRHICSFCKEPLWEHSSEACPFANCFFCGDEPAYHHGWCCPHNRDSLLYEGPSHYQQYVARWTHSRLREHCNCDFCRPLNPC